MIFAIKKISKILGFKIIGYVTKKTRDRVTKDLTAKFEKEKRDILLSHARKEKFKEKLIKVKERESEKDHKYELDLIKKSNKYYKKTHLKHKEKRQNIDDLVDSVIEKLNPVMDSVLAGSRQVLHILEYLDNNLSKYSRKYDPAIQEMFDKADNIADNVFKIREKRVRAS